ncbi:MAG: carbohydrate ABC transporter permease [Chloroflexota bacterium]|nr:carbohydrate ABC transporter permease [Chloroflexota bacterium]
MIAEAKRAQSLSQETEASILSKIQLDRILLYVVVALGSFIFMFPFMWAFISSGKTVSEINIFPPTLWPKHPQFVKNYTQIFIEAPFLLWIKNSLVVTALNLSGTVISASIVAYSFARFKYPGRDILFFIMLSTMMIPSEVQLIPTYLIFHKLGWVNTIKPLWVPAWLGGGAFNIFLLRQFYMGIPLDLDESAEIDGAGPLRIFLTIILPLSKPVLGTVAALSFIGNWNNFMGPLIYLNDPEKLTVAVGLRVFSQGVTSSGMQAGLAPPQYNLVMAASIVVAAPCLILFFVAQRYFVQGIVTTGIKG